MNIYAKENISAEQSPSRKKTRLQSEDGDEERSRRDQTPPGQGTQEIDGSALLDFRLPKESRLLKPPEFQKVYAEGTCLKKHFMTAFVAPSASAFQRLGVTASKKAIGKAHERNRAKRLLREAFRLSKAELAELSVKYDWVLNARKSLLDVKLEKPLAEFRQIIRKVKNFEIEQGEDNVVNLPK
jgi:ribonuclease P protein component